MEERKELCLLQTLLITAMVALGIFMFIIGKKIAIFLWFKVSGVTKALKMRSQQNSSKIDIQKEVLVSRMAAVPIATEDWVDFKQLIEHSRLQERLIASLEEECNRNDQRFTKFIAWMDAFKEDFERARAVIQKQEELIERLRKLPVTATETHITGDTCGEQNQSRSIIALTQKDLQELCNKLTSQRNEVMVELKNIVTQLFEDLKKTIKTDFSKTNYQEQTSFSQLDDVVRGALNKNTEQMITTNFEAIGEKLQKIVQSLKSLDFDVSSIKQTLDNIDGQFDDIFKKLELGCQKNAEHAEEVANDLNVSKKEWNEKSSQLDEVCKQLTCATQGVKDMLATLDCDLNQTLVKRNPSWGEKESNKITDMLTVAKICQEKLESMNDQINQSTSGVHEASDLVLKELQLLHNTVKHGVVSWKQLTDLYETQNQLSKMIRQQQEESVDDRFTTLDTISEYTEESQFDTESSIIPHLLKAINASLENASMQDVNNKVFKDSKLFHKANK